MIRDYQRTGQPSQWDFHEVAEFLTGRGFFIGPAGIGTALDTENPSTVLVKVDLDANVPQAALDAALDAFVPTVDPVKAAEVEMRQAYVALKAAAEATPPADPVVAALVRVVMRFGTARAGVG